MIKRLSCILFLLFILGACSTDSSHGYSKLDNQDARQLSDPVYITKYGKRYHRRNCVTIKFHEMKVVERADAASIGRTACAKCHP